MFTTRMRPKMRVRKPLATMKYNAAAVTPLSSVMRKSLGVVDRRAEGRIRRDEQDPDDRERDDQRKEHQSRDPQRLPADTRGNQVGRN